MPSSIVSRGSRAHIVMDRKGVRWYLFHSKKKVSYIKDFIRSDQKKRALSPARSGALV